ncbi:MAG TPA: SUMF1/EgtB/PvdO family nonheme iron enzyme [Gemmataceae bacterium]|jgi:formylglycine-generating enzyme required for sulfatase activity/predicted Ser/Thr protein kinase|nr:SUMF1/EgtB/PvdO family nonheme iron enzyme [Gemmataceae bacterium]
MEWSCPHCKTPLPREAISATGAACPRCGQQVVLGADDAGKEPTAAYSMYSRETKSASTLPAPAAVADDPVPAAAKIGRYTIQRRLGKGGFGTVYLARDEELHRPVAIKVPRADRLGSEKEIEAALKEAQIAAGLKHPGIVTVHDVGRLGEGGCYFVMEYVPGRSLAEVLAEEKLTYAQIACLVLDVADALRHAHQQGLVHRDLKPSNILIDPAGRPRIADFGLAIEERSQHLAAGQVAGTPAYMAPEQARGESHRLDGRTDLWSLGVILYEMLTGRRPFVGRHEELFDDILHREPKPPRQVNDAIPRELERICLKCLSKRMSDRYSTAADLAEDLGHWRDRERDASAGDTANRAPAANGAGADAPLPETSRLLVRVVPKGLRSFDAQDAEFFLGLLPGPRDRHGLPDSLSFWKTRLEETDADKTFSVGLIYGPSGCGKTSMVKAGLLPRLARHVTVVYLECTPDGTEARLLKGLRKQCPGLPEGLGLVQTLAALRQDGLAPGAKAVVVLDQFEQWLHADRDTREPELVQALRQCDGGHVQCVLMVRDDFWMAISGFMRDLEVRLLEGDNSAPVDLFGMRHARKVLAEFGRAFGCLPDHLAEMTREQQQFLERAVAELAQDGKVIPVRLSLFTEMIKTRTWSPGTLQAMGGTKGLGVTFLEETFGSPTAPPAHRRHQRAARAVLQSLLPDQGADIKGGLRSRRDLLTASGYDRRPQDFDELLQILDTELRLVTPADPQAADQDADAPVRPEHAPSYQLTHDYLVPPLRQWLTRKQKETWRGRAALTLDERAAQWGRAHDRRFLPSLPEYLAIQLGVPRGQRKPDQQALLRAAARHHGLRWGGLLAAVLAAAFLLRYYLGSVQQTTRQQRTEALVETALQASADGVPYAIKKLQAVDDLALPLLRARFRDEALDFRHRLHAAVALAALGEVEEDFLLDSIATAPASEGQNVLSALGPARGRVIDRVRRRLRREKDPKVRVRLAATLLHLGDATAAREFLAFRHNPAGRTAFIHDFASWRGDLAGLPVLLRDSDDPALRSGLCAALGTVKPDLLDAAQQERLQEVLVELYRQSPDGGTHSAAGWALRQWGLRPPALGAGGSAAEGRRWFVNRHGMTMLAISPGTFTMGDAECDSARPHPVSLTRPFFLCDREVSLDLFRQFVADADAAVETPTRWTPPAKLVTPTGDCPVLMVNWQDAVLFCNWLSRREGRQPCYHRTGVKTVKLNDKKVSMPVWRCDFAAAGYRLPTEAEWEYACRAGTTTRWSFGDDEGDLDRYGVVHQPQAAPVATKLPNDWGLFDMHGNAREWCWDGYDEDYPTKLVTDPRGPEAHEAPIHRGGSWFDYPHACRSAFRNWSRFNLRDNVIGFRVGCGAPAPARTARQ